MTRLLKDLKITEVSSVDRGAGRGVKVLLMKRDGANPGDIEMTKEELEAAIAKAAKDAAETATTATTKLFTAELAKRDEVINLLKMLPAHKAYMDQCDEATKKSFGAMDDKDRDAFISKNPIKKRDEPVTIEDLAKRDGLVGDLAKKLDSQGKELEGMRLEKAQGVFKKQAADLGATAEGDGELMRKAYGGDAEAQTKWTARLAEVNKALKEQVETGKLFEEFGTRKSETGTAYAEVEAKAADLRKADPKLTPEMAFAKVYEDPANIGLRKRVQDEENRGQRHAA